MSPPRVGALATKATGTSKRTLQCKPTSLEESWASWGVRYSLIPTSQGPYRDFCVAMQISVPLACILGRYMFVMAVLIRTFPLCPLSLSLRHGSSFALARVLDNDHKFLVACDRGDLIAVRSMLQDGQGRPTDIGDKNWTPLAVSQSQYQNESPEACYLLENSLQYEAAERILWESCWTTVLTSTEVSDLCKHRHCNSLSGTNSLMWSVCCYAAEPRKTI